MAWVPIFGSSKPTSKENTNSKPKTIDEPSNLDDVTVDLNDEVMESAALPSDPRFQRHAGFEFGIVSFSFGFHLGGLGSAICPHLSTKRIT